MKISHITILDSLQYGSMEIIINNSLISDYALSLYSCTHPISLLTNCHWIIKLSMSSLIDKAHPHLL